jgi:uncharacterized membrane protein
MKLKVVFALLLILSILSPAHAVEYRSYKIIAEVVGDTVNEELVITLLNDGPAELTSGTVTVPEGSEILSVRDSYGDLNYATSEEKGLRIDFSFDVPVKQGEERLIIIKLQTESLVTKKDGYFEYLLVLTPKQDISDFEHVLKLPKDARLYSPKESFSLVVPEASVTDDGTVVWKVSLYANMPEVFLARYRLDSGGIWLEGVFAVLALGTIVVLGIAANSLRIAHRKKKTLDSLNILNERERRVLEEIVKNEGIKQYELQNELDYTKTSLSKILARLEARGLVKKKRFGKINKLYPGEKL